MECVTGLPANSISLDSTTIYWTGSSGGVFSVPRNNVTVVSQLSGVNVTSVVTIDPGQQSLPGKTHSNINTTLMKFFLQRRCAYFQQ